MTWVLVLLVLFLLGGIVLLSAKSPLKQLTREEYLQELAKFLDGTLELTDKEEGCNSFQIRFKFKNEEFLYEDLEKQGFKDKIYKAHLKIKAPGKLTLTFTEKKRSTKIRTDIFIASDVSARYMDHRDQLQVPEHLKDLKVFASDIEEANKIFEDKKSAAILKRYKNIDDRGYPFLSFEIVDGLMTLEFHSEKPYKPNISALREDVTSIDDHLEQLVFIARKLEEKS